VTCRAQFCGQRLGMGQFDIGDSDFAAAPGDLHTQSAADALGATGDQRDAVLQFAHGLPRYCS
jgi:hypothetical protein